MNEFNLHILRARVRVIALLEMNENSATLKIINELNGCLNALKDAHESIEASEESFQDMIEEIDKAQEAGRLEDNKRNKRTGEL